MKLLRQASQGLLVLLLLTVISALGQASNPLVVIDQYGNGGVLFQNGSGNTNVRGYLKVDPGPGGLASALTYDLQGPPALVAGDVIVVDAVTSALTDVVRFNPAGTGGNSGYPASVIFYSKAGGGTLADTGFPSTFYSNSLTFVRGSNDLVYIPTSAQPGFIPGFHVVYEVGIIGPRTSTLVTSLNNPSIYGEELTFRASANVTYLLSPDSILRDGKFSFFANANPIAGCQNVPVEVTHAICHPGLLTGGNHTITANYIPVGDLPPSTGSVLQVVNTAASTVENTVDDPDPSIQGRPYKVTPQIFPKDPIRTGKITVSDGAGGSCEAILPATSCSLSSTRLGQLMLTVAYSGDKNYSSASMLVSHTVIAATPTPTPSPSPTPTPTPTPTPSLVNCFVYPGCEGDINRVLARPEDSYSRETAVAGDGLIDGDDLTWYDRFVNGANCPQTGGYPINEFQRMDVAPFDAGGDGALGLDRAEIERLIAGIDPKTAAGGPLAPSTPFCSGTFTSDTEQRKAGPSDQRVIRALRIGSVESHRDSTIEVPIEGDFAGDEIMAQFTVHFDPAVLSMRDPTAANLDPDVLLADKVKDATRVIINTTNIGSGDIGIIVYFNGSGQYPSRTARPGTNKLVSLRFYASSELKNSSPTLLTFADTVFPIKTSDPFGRRLPLDGGLVGGSVKIRQR